MMRSAKNICDRFSALLINDKQVVISRGKIIFQKDVFNGFLLGK